MVYQYLLILLIALNKKSIALLLNEIGKKLHEFLTEEQV